MSDTVLYYTDFLTPLGRWYIASTKNGICRLDISGGEEGFFKALNRAFPTGSIQLNRDVHTCIIEQLLAYLHGQLRTFHCPLDLIGTPFQKKVWQALQGIPYGALVSYRDIAAAIGMPHAYRAVGNANGRNPVPIIIPCHRVIASDGSLGGYSAGLELKKKLIALERGCTLF